MMNIYIMLAGIVLTSILAGYLLWRICRLARFLGKLLPGVKLNSEIKVRKMRAFKLKKPELRRNSAADTPGPLAPQSIEEILSSQSRETRRAAQTFEDWEFMTETENDPDEILSGHSQYIHR